HCDLAVFVPVKPEGLPWVILEAMAAAKPVIGTDQGVMAEVIVNGSASFVLRGGEPVTPEHRLQAGASRPAQAAMTGVKRCRRRVEDVYSEVAAHRSLAKLLLESIAQKPYIAAEEQ